MQQNAINEGAAIATKVLTALMATAQLTRAELTAATASSVNPSNISSSATTNVAQFNLQCGALIADAASELVTGTFWADFAACFDAAQVAGAPLTGIDGVRAMVLTLTPATAAGRAVVNFAVRMCLVEEAKILAATTFTSTQDVTAALDAINCAFDQAEELAANNFDQLAYRALIGLHATVANDLNTRALQLPQLVTYMFPVRKPALWIAQRLYQDPTRALQLVQENKIVHPAFCPNAGACLSA